MIRQLILSVYEVIKDKNENIVYFYVEEIIMIDARKIL